MNMNKALSIYGWAWAVLVACAVLTFQIWMIVPSHHDRAEDPESIEKIIKADLPHFEAVVSENNLYRSASCWDCYMHEARFSEELSEETMAVLDELCQSDPLRWSKNVDKGYYLYNEESKRDHLYYVTCCIYKDHAYMEYIVDEAEGVLLVFPFILAMTLLKIWGAVLLVLLSVRWIRRLLAKHAPSQKRDAADEFVDKR